MASEGLLNTNIDHLEKQFGFIGLDVMGIRIVKNMIISGHKILVWNRTIKKVIIMFICKRNKTIISNLLVTKKKIYILNTFFF